jgi:hypothetical protein
MPVKSGLRQLTVSLNIPGKPTLDLAQPRLLVQAFRISGLDDVKRRIHIHLDERYVRLFVDLPGDGSVCFVWGNESGDHDGGCIGEKLGNLWDMVYVARLESAVERDAPRQFYECSRCETFHRNPDLCSAQSERCRRQGDTRISSGEGDAARERMLS